MNSQEICRQTRKLASDSLCRALDQALKSDEPISEVALRDAWLDELRKGQTVFPDGWYTPPPHGMAVLFSADGDADRVNYQSLRPPEKWPRDDVYLDKQNGLMYLYVSPVDARTGIIGDFGVTLYLGNNPEIKELLKQCMALDRDIFEYSQVGMKLSGIASYAASLMRERGMSNEVVSATDATGSNIGHTIPAPVSEWTADEKAAFAGASDGWDTVAKVLNQKRIFTNPAEDYALRAGDGLTIEPRPSLSAKPGLPTSLSYHTIALYKSDGQNELLTDFDELFALTDMNYMT